MFDLNKISSGTLVYIGAPATPMSDERFAALRSAVVENVTEVAFAYVPMVSVQGQIDPPRQVLYLVLREAMRDRLERFMPDFAAAIHRCLPQGDFIDILPVFCDHPWMAEVLRSGCVLCIIDKIIHDGAKTTLLVIRKPLIIMSPSKFEVLRQLIDRPGVAFAYVPEMHGKGVVEPAQQVIYLVLEDSLREQVDPFMHELVAALGSRDGDAISIYPAFADHAWLPNVLRTGAVLVIRNMKSHEQAIARLSGSTLPAGR